MPLTRFQFNELLPDLFLYRGAVNCGILKHGEQTLLIDCDDTLTPTRLAELGIVAVERICCTQHRRPNTAGIYNFEAPVFVPQAERAQFENASAYWQDWRNRWHLYHFRPGPLAPLHDIPVRGTLQERDAFAWGGFTIQVLDTPGMSDGAISFVVETADGKTVIFSGDALYGPGQLWDVHSLQKSMGTWSDYHGFLGAAKTLLKSLARLARIPADFLVPSHGELIPEHTAAIRLTSERLEKLYRNYAAISAINHYFPEIFQELANDPWRMPPAEVHAFPDFILPVAATTFAIRSDSGALFLVDCGYGSALDILASWKEQGRFTELEGCWVSHYHDDHVDALHQLAASLPVPIYADEHLAEILAHPGRFDLPCLSPAAAPVTHVTRHGESWRWHEFELTALHFPGQTLYHGGLLLRGHGLTVLFGGDSFAPSGLDDYTAGNRNFLGGGLGYRHCLDLLRQHRPDLVLNQHQEQAFHFTDEQLDTMEKMLVEREALVGELLPWENPNFGTDAGWLRVYPYEVEAASGGACTLEVRATNHGSRPTGLHVQAVLPPGWTAFNQPALDCPPVRPGEEWLVKAPVWIANPPGTPSGCYPVAFRITWGERYLGQVCQGQVKVW